MPTRTSVFVALAALTVTLRVVGQDSAPQRSWLVRVDPIDIGARERDERPAEVDLDFGDGAAIDVSTFRVVRVDERGELLAVDGDASRDQSLPLQWYDAAIPYDFPEFQDLASRTAAADCWCKVSTQGACFVERSFSGGSYAKGIFVE